MHLPRRSQSYCVLGIACMLFVLLGSAWALAAEAVPAAKPETPADVKPEAAYGKTHPCTGAGKWFPADAAELRKAVEAVTQGEPMPLAQAPTVLIVPHAGYQFSGPVAGRAMLTVKGRSYKRVILMGPSHQAPVKGASVLRTVESFETPLGSIPVDTEVRDALLKSPSVSEQPAAHKNEHSVENQLPFLQVMLKDFKMVELLVGEMAASDRTALADLLRPFVDNQTLLVVSSDFTHYGEAYRYTPWKWRVPENLKELNDAASGRILQVDVGGLDKYLADTHDTICGAAAIGLALQIMAPMEDIQPMKLAFDMSGRKTNDYTNSVTYASFMFWRSGSGLNEAEQKTLLKLARDAAEGFLKTQQAPKLDEKSYDLTPALKGPGAAFVTLKTKGDLRGCIGHVVAQMPLSMSVVQNACQACGDPRFTKNPLSVKDLPDLSIEISVLSAMRRVTDPQKIQVGRDGLVISRGNNRGLLLPQVAGEQKWDRDAFLVGACKKAGLPDDAWKDAATEIYRFTAQVFADAKAEEKKPDEKKPDEKKPADK